MVEEAKVEVKEEIKDPEVKEEKVETEVDPLEEKRQAILSEKEEVPTGEEEKGKEKDLEKGEAKTGDVDWGKLMEEFPQLAKLGIKNVQDLASRYAGGLEEFNKDREYITELEKRGIKDPREKEELLKKLEAGEDLKIAPDDDKPKTFIDTRKEALLKLIPKDVDTGEVDENTGDPITRPLTDEERDAKLSDMAGFSELVYPSEHAEMLQRADNLAIETLDDRTWEQFQIGKLLKEKFKDEITPDETRTKIMDYMKAFPATRNEIIRKARDGGRNYWEALHNYWLSQVNKDDIDKEKEVEIRKRVESELKKKADAKTETKKTKGEPLGTSESFEDLSLMAKRKAIEGT